MSLPEIRDKWGVPARPGQRVAVDQWTWYAQDGTIIGATEDRIRVRLDTGRETLVHPAALIYLTDRHDPKDYR